MIVRCIKEDSDRSITNHRWYEVLAIDGDYYEIRNDHEVKYSYHKDRFEVEED